MISYPFKKERTLFMNIRWNIILGVIALALLGWYYSLNQDHSDLQSLIKKPDSPEYVGNKMETTVFSPEGKKQYLAISDKVEHYTQDGHTDFISPLVYLFDGQGSDAGKFNHKVQEVTYGPDRLSMTVAAGMWNIALVTANTDFSGGLIQPVSSAARKALKMWETQLSGGTLPSMTALRTANIDGQQVIGGPDN